LRFGPDGLVSPPQIGCTVAHFNGYVHVHQKRIESMMTSGSHSPGQWSIKASIALFAMTIALAGGERAVAPDSASALITAEECVDNWLDCVDNGPQWGGSDPNGGTTGKPEDPYGDDPVIGPPEDPYAGWPEDPYGDDNAKRGHPEDPYADDPPLQPYRGCLDDGTSYDGPLTETDLQVTGQLTPRQDPTKPFQGKVDNGTYYEGDMTEQDLIVMGMLKRHRIPCHAPEPGSHRGSKGAMRLTKAKAKAKRQKARQRSARSPRHR
jgi:hypothetical protein